ncbi:MAG: hypothetical protein J5827_01730 [Oscillospiraceae bacterium]|nr:hypothetical protein [Oscillospiraceae bacterium]
MAALRAGIKTVLIPQDNESDLEEIDQTVRRALNFITVSHIDNILDTALDLSAVHREEEPEMPPEITPAERRKRRPKATGGLPMRQ